MALTFANHARGQQGAKTEVLHGHTDRLHNLVHELFPTKPAAHLAELTGLSISAWHKSLRDRRDFSPGALWSLFRAPRLGARFLRAFIGDDHRDEWYVELRKRERLREVEEEFEPAMREIDNARNAQGDFARHHKANGQMGQARERHARPRRP